MQVQEGGLVIDPQFRLQPALGHRMLLGGRGSPLAGCGRLGTLVLATLPAEDAVGPGAGDGWAYQVVFGSFLSGKIFGIPLPVKFCSSSHFYWAAQPALQ